jgi:3-hydroxyisobutyrate dehydrogenase-like beta-hydroxyacid dehydrogenase
MRITVVGLGIIGGIWARHLTEDGHAVRSWNRSAKPDAPGFTALLAQAVCAAELIMIVVADPPAVAAVLSHILPAMPPGVIIAQHSTVGADHTISYARQVQAAGGLFIDMPFTGSKPAAQNRENIFFVGDDGTVLPRIAAVYQRLAKELVVVGAIGHAMAIKLAFNLLIANLNQAYCESFELAKRSGIPPDIYFKALALNVAKAPLADLKRPKYQNGDYSPQFSIKHMHKDLLLALQLGTTHQLPLASTRTVSDAYSQAMQRGMGDLDFAALLDIVRNPD